MAKKSKWFIVATNIYQDSLRRMHIRPDQIGGVPAPRVDPDKLKKFYRTFNMYMKYSGLTPAALSGRRILEIGPGEYIGVPLLFLANGAQSAVCMDRFVPYQETDAHLNHYRALRESLTDEQRHRFDGVIRLDSRIQLRRDRLEFIYGKGIEDTSTMFPARSFDFIISNAVLEEVYQIDKAFDFMDRLLAPGGYSMHKIDLRDYGMFTKHGFHPLEFLTLPDEIYRYMSESAGQPNRRLVNYYRDKGRAPGYDTKIFIAAILGHPEMPEYKLRLERGADYTDADLSTVEKIRPRLLERYRKLSSEDLLTGTILFIARKPAVTTPAQAGDGP